MKRSIYWRSGTLVGIILTLTTLLSIQNEEGDPVVKVTEVSTNKKYGKKPKTAIKVGTVPNEYEFLAQLSGPNGEKIKYQRIQSCCPFKCDTAPFGRGLLDEWEIKIAGKKKSMIIYLNGYEYDDPKAPKGLGIKSSF